MTSESVTRLATVVSLAARIEPELLRAARLRLLPDVDVSAEGDLWFSDLVASRSTRRIVLNPHDAASLRQSLAGDPALLNAARAIVTETHTHAPSAIQLEEEIVYLALTGADVADAINTKLTSVLNAIATEGRRGLIDWVARALPAMPAVVQNTTAAAALRLVAGGQKQTSDAVYVSRDPVLAALVERALPKTKVFARLVPREAGGTCVEISRTQRPEAHEIELPKTEPLVVELTALGQTEVVDVPREGALLRDMKDSVAIRTIARDVFRLEEVRAKGRERKARLLMTTRLTTGVLSWPEDTLDGVLIPGDVVERGNPQEFILAADYLRGRYPSTPILAVPGPIDVHFTSGKVVDVKDFLRFRERLGFTSDQVNFAKTLVVEGHRIGVVGIFTTRSEGRRGVFESWQIADVCEGDPFGWSNAHDATILMMYHAPQSFEPESQQRWEAFGAGDAFDLIVDGSDSMPQHTNPDRNGHVMIEIGVDIEITPILPNGQTRVQPIRVRPTTPTPDKPSPSRVLVAGIAEGVSIRPQELSRAIGTLLALQGHHLITGGWPGVDYLVAEGFERAAPNRVESIAHYFGGLRKEPDYRRGLTHFFEREEDALSQAVADADVVILIEGASGTYSVGREAISQGKPVIPIGGGAAADLRDMAIRPGRWTDDTRERLRRLDDTASVATIVHDVSELIRVARPHEPDPLEPVFISHSDDSRIFNQFEYHAEQLIVERARFSRDIHSLSRARFAVVFIGPAYLEDKQKRDELQAILDRAMRGDLTIFWFLESRCDFASTGIDRFMAAHDVTRPLDTLSAEEFRRVYDVAANQFAEQLLASAQEAENVTGPVDFLVLTTLPEEREAVLRKLDAPRRLEPVAGDFQTYFISKLSDRRVLLTSIPMGPADASIAAAKAIERFDPRGILFVGIAAGIRESGVAPGDIVVAEDVIQFTAFSGLETRWEASPADPSLLAAAHNLSWSEYQNVLDVPRPDEGRPFVHFAPIGIGDIIFASEEALAAYRSLVPNLATVEMSATATSFLLENPRRFLIVRGVADLNTSSVSPEWRAYATAAAAAFAVALMKSASLPESAHGMKTKPRK